MTSRERVMNALNFQATDKLPKDLGAMASTGITQWGTTKMVSQSHVFDADHGGQQLDFAASIPLKNLKKLKNELTEKQLRDEQIINIREQV